MARSPSMSFRYVRIISRGDHIPRSKSRPSIPAKTAEPLAPPSLLFGALGPCSALACQRLGELAGQITQNRADHKRDDQEDQRIGETDRGQVLERSGRRRGRGLVQRIADQRCIAVDICRHGGKRLDRSHDHQEEHGHADDDSRPDRQAAGIDRDVNDDHERDPGENRAIGSTDDRLGQGFVVTASMKEASPGDETRPYQNEAAQGSEREKRPDSPEYGDTQGKTNHLRHGVTPTPSILVTGLCATQLAPHPSVEAARADSQELPSIHHRSESLQRNFASAGDSPGLVVPKFQANKTYCLFLRLSTLVFGVAGRWRFPFFALDPNLAGPWRPRIDNSS